MTNKYNKKKRKTSKKYKFKKRGGSALVDTTIHQICISYITNRNNTNLIKSTKPDDNIKIDEKTNLVKEENFSLYKDMKMSLFGKLFEIQYIKSINNYELLEKMFYCSKLYSNKFTSYFKELEKNNKEKYINIKNACKLIYLFYNYKFAINYSFYIDTPLNLELFCIHMHYIKKQSDIFISLNNKKTDDFLKIFDTETYTFTKIFNKLTEKIKNNKISFKEILSIRTEIEDAFIIRLEPSGKILNYSYILLYLLYDMSTFINITNVIQTDQNDPDNEYYNILYELVKLRGIADPISLPSNEEINCDNENRIIEKLNKY
jgi:hypothetical protein